MVPASASQVRVGSTQGGAESSFRHGADTHLDFQVPPAPVHPQADAPAAPMAPPQESGRAFTEMKVHSPVDGNTLEAAEKVTTIVGKVTPHSAEPATHDQPLIQLAVGRPDFTPTAKAVVTSATPHHGHDHDTEVPPHSAEPATHEQPQVRIAVGRSARVHDAEVPPHSAEPATHEQPQVRIAVGRSARVHDAEVPPHSAEPATGEQPEFEVSGTVSPGFGATTSSQVSGSISISLGTKE